MALVGLQRGNVPEKNGDYSAGHTKQPGVLGYIREWVVPKCSVGR